MNTHQIGLIILGTLLLSRTLSAWRTGELLGNGWNPRSTLRDETPSQFNIGLALEGVFGVVILILSVFVR